MMCSIQTFEKFREEWYAKVQMMKSLTWEIDDDDLLCDAFLQNIDDEVIKFLNIRLGSLERISVSHLLLEIKYHVVKWSDINNHLMEVTQNPN